MKNLRINEQKRVDTSPCGFTVAKKGESFDFCVRLLGAKKGKLDFFDHPKTTTISIRADEGKLEQVRSLFETIELVEEDFFYSVSVPYVDKYDFLQKVVDKHQA
jgi:hypothetical protein